MHLGINLRKAQNAGILAYEKENNIEQDNYPENGEDEQSTPNQSREYVPIDTFVHAFCKLLGQHGTPEYGQGIAFKDYLSKELKQAKSSGDTNKEQYLEKAVKTNLQRQVGKGAGTLLLLIIRQESFSCIKQHWLFLRT